MEDRTSRFLVGPIFDSVFFIFSPAWALGLGILLAWTGFGQTEVTFLGYSEEPLSIFLGAFIMAHLGIVFFRTHGNPEIRQTFPYRFFLVPVLLFLAMMSSLWVLAFVSLLATWWDVYHSGMQTFGLGRIYDGRAGNQHLTGRRLDIILHQLCYLGPILGGASLIDHIEEFDVFQNVDSIFLYDTVPAFAMSYHSQLFQGILSFGILFAIFYFYKYYTFYKAGYAVSWQKVVLYVSTVFVSIYTWGFNSFGQAFFIMNFFHALQYFAIIWWAEKNNMQRSAGLSHLKLPPLLKRVMTFVAFISIATAYGIWAETQAGASDIFLAITLTVSIMHFWYDGFIWGARRVADRD